MSAASAVLLPGFVGPTLPAWLEARLREGLAGVCLFATNIRSREQLRQLTASILAANPRAVIAIDEEGGDVTRLYSDQGSPYPGNALLGRLDDVELTTAVAEAVGWELRRVGVNLNFAPDVDINSNPNNPVIGTRSFGSDATLVARHAAAWTRGLQVTGVAASAKHFPGHGDTAQDSHLALPVVDLSLDELMSRELVPFAAVVAAGSKTIMTSHILLPQLDATRPATLSPTILQGLLRDRLGYRGVIVSDALDMKGASGEVGIPGAAVLALAAGSDLLCIGTENTDEQLGQIAAAIEAAVADGRLEARRLDDAVARVAQLGAGLEQAALDIPIPEYTRVDLPLARVISAFAVSRAALSARDSLAARSMIATIETTANIAVGPSPWGLEASGRQVIHLYEGDVAPDSDNLVLVGKDNHRRAWVRELIDLARERHPGTLVVDMGWPSSDRRYADVATFGASRLVGLALDAWTRKEDA